MKKQNVLNLFIIVLIAFVLVGCNEKTFFSGGEGTKENPYQISSPDDLVYLAEQVNNGNTKISSAYFVQSNDIDLEDIKWSPIGKFTSYPDMSRPFLGEYDGKGHSIKNIVIESNVTIEDFAKYKNLSFGFWGYISGGKNTSAVLKNIVLDNIQIKVNADDGIYTPVGGLVGSNSHTDLRNPELSNSKVTNCTVTAVNIETNALDVGLFVGNNIGIIDGCYVEGNNFITPTISNTQNVGGFVGRNSNKIINSDCTSEINLGAGFDGNMGGFAGINGDEMLNSFTNATIQSCFTTTDLYINEKSDMEDASLGKFLGANYAKSFDNEFLLRANVNKKISTNGEG